MNGEQQRERHSAIAELHRDVETIVNRLAEEIVKHGEQVTDDLQVFEERLRIVHEREAARLDAADRDLSLRIDAHRGMTLWRRLQWLIVGCARG